MNRSRNRSGQEPLFPGENENRAEPSCEERSGVVEGLAQVEFYVSRMLHSTAKRKSLTVFCWEHQDKTVLILICPRGVINTLIFIKTAEAGRERAIRDIFTEAGIAPLQDEVTGNTGDESRFLRYPLPGQLREATMLVRGLLQRGYGLDEFARLEFRYREKKGA